MAAKPTLGSLLRALRARQGLTLKEMSDRVGIPFSTLSKVEHDRLTLSYDKLLQISERLNIRLTEMFAEPEPQLRNTPNGRRSIGRLDGALNVTTKNYDYYYLSPELRHKEMIPILARVRSRSMADFGGLVTHDGEEFIYVVDGAIEVHTEFYDPLVLTVGESVYIDSKMGHAYIATGEKPEALILSVCSTSQEELIQHIAPMVTEPDAAAPPRPAVARRPGRPKTAAGKAYDLTPT